MATESLPETYCIYHTGIPSVETRLKSTYCFLCPLVGGLFRQHKYEVPQLTSARLSSDLQALQGHWQAQNAAAAAVPTKHTSQSDAHDSAHTFHVDVLSVIRSVFSRRQPACSDFTCVRLHHEQTMRRENDLPKWWSVIYQAK